MNCAMAKETGSLLLSDVYKKENRRRRRVIFWIIALIAYCVFLGATWLVVRSPLFRIQNMEISGNKTVSNENIRALAERKISNGSFWKKALGVQNMLVWPEHFSSDDLRIIPELKSVLARKNYGKRTIVIAVKERRPFGVWCFVKPQMNADETLINADTSNGNISENPRINLRESASDCWWFDDDGTLFTKALKVEGNLITVVNDYSQKNLGAGSKILPNEFIPNIFSVFQVISESDFSVKEIRLNDIHLQEVEVDTYGGSPAGVSAKAGPKLYFSLRFPADNTLAVIQSLKNQPGLGKLQYIDFRLENRAYYK